MNGKIDLNYRLLTTISSDIVQISGQTVQIQSGQKLQVITASGDYVVMSGSISASASGNIISLASGTGPIVISGVAGTIALSGEIFRISGQAVEISGQTVSITSGQSVQVITASGNNLTIIDGNIVDLNNSTITPLGSGAVFTGTGTDLLNFSQVTLQVLADQNSATNGLQEEFSSDNVHWDHIHTNTVQANDSESIHLAVDSRFFRVVYTNGTNAQGSSGFRLTTILKPVPSQATIKNADLVPNMADDAMLVHGIITGITTAGGVNSGIYVDVKVSPSGAIQVGGDVFIDSGIITVGSGLVSTSISGNVVSLASGTGPIVISGTVGIISGQTLIDINQLSNLTGASGSTLKSIQGSGNRLLPVVIMGLDPTSTAPTYRTISTDTDGSIHVINTSGEYIVVSGTIGIISGQLLIDINQLSNVVGASGSTLKSIQGSGNQLLPVVMMGLDPTSTAPTYRTINTDSDGSIHVINTSGEYIVVSGSVGLTPPTTVKTINMLSVTGVSGGVVLSSTTTTNITACVVKAWIANSGNIWLGGNATPFANSGVGMFLTAGDSIAMDINNFNSIYVFAEISGDKVTAIGVN